MYEVGDGNFQFLGRYGLLRADDADLLLHAVSDHHHVVEEMIILLQHHGQMRPVALSLSNQLGVSPMPFFVVICIAASASFSTPIGYQTNLIVQGIGNYKFTDFVRIGLPLNILTFIISVILIPLIWPF